MRERVVEGGTLADAMKAHPRVFNDLYVNMVRAGEASGALDLVLVRLADYTERAAALRGKVRSRAHLSGAHGHRRASASSSSCSPTSCRR